MDYPNILVLAGHDPSGGAGLQADIEAIAAQQAHAVTVVTLLTCQDTHNVHGVVPVDSAFFRACIDTVLADMPIAAIKVGVVANIEQVRIISEVAARLAPVPLVVDPVLKAAGGGRLADSPVGEALVRELFRHATVVTPNAAEARLLCDDEAGLDACGERLCQHARHALITGGDEPGAEVVNTLYTRGAPARGWRWPRVAGRFHGSGCTLASTLAARLARGDDLTRAVENAQRITWAALDAGFAAGGGQRIPRRLHRTSGAQP